MNIDLVAITEKELRENGSHLYQNVYLYDGIEYAKHSTDLTTDVSYFVPLRVHEVEDEE